MAKPISFKVNILKIALFPKRIKAERWEQGIKCLREGFEQSNPITVEFLR